MDFILPIDPLKVRPRYKTKRYHPLIDYSTKESLKPKLELSAPTGAPVRAIGPGHVLNSEFSKVYGYQVVVEHNDSITSTYTHLSKLSVEAGQHVNKGQLVGLVGCSGLSAAPHLALYMRINNELVSPCSLLPCEQLPTVE